MLVEEERVSQNNLDSCRGHLLVGFPIMISIIIGEIFAYWSDFFQLGKAFDME